MIVRSCLRGALVAASLLSASAVMAQEPEAAPPPPAAETPAKPKPRPRPKPKPKPVPKAETGREAGPSEAAQPELRTGMDEALPPAAGDPPTTPSPGGFAAPPVACDPGQAVQYDGPKGFSLWVTRVGSVTIDNPLRPLTPDITRVLQLVIGDRLATAYGRDLSALRRGASPAALESLLGGPIHWEAHLGSLPDGFDIVSDSGAPLAQMRFKACGNAPAAKASPAPVARKDGKARSKKAAADPAGSPSPPAASAPGAPGAPSPRPAAPQRQFNLPQGAIGE